MTTYNITIEDFGRLVADVQHDLNLRDLVERATANIEAVVHDVLNDADYSAGDRLDEFEGLIEDVQGRVEDTEFRLRELEDEHGRRVDNTADVEDAVTNQLNNMKDAIETLSRQVDDIMTWIDNGPRY